jgi:predicted CXXCH cytochrome family protein
MKRNTSNMGACIRAATLAAMLALWPFAVVTAQPAGENQAAHQRPTTLMPDCTAGGCHSEVTRFDILHGPMGVSACNACHTPADPAKHTFSLTRPGKDLCLFCHELPELPVVHEPMHTGVCTDCHNPHGGRTRGFLNVDPPAALCLKCHEDVTRGQHFVHGPVAAGGCIACHAPHNSNHAHLLLKQSRDLCLDCHVSSAQRMERSRVIHEPAGKDCLLCHDAHASSDRMILRMPAQPLCLSCHEDIRSTVEHAKTQHGAVVEGRQCLNCHEPHATDFPRILRDNPMSLCMECHNREIKTPQGVIADMSAILATGKSLHGPVAENNCAACHEIHGGDLFRLLVKEYPPEFYAPFKEENYALCFSCHESALVVEPRTTTLTGFRNGDLNLHFLHVNRDTKETHASDKANHIRNSVPFGKWEMPIGFEKTATGGSCAPGCHVPYEYDRLKPVRYDIQPGRPAPIWPKEEP